MEQKRKKRKWPLIVLLILVVLVLRSCILRPIRSVLTRKNTTTTSQTAATTAPTEKVTEPKEDKKDENFYVGTWRVSAVTDKKNTRYLDDLINAGKIAEGWRDVRLVFSEDGTYWFNGAQGNWTVSDTGIICNGKTELELDNDTILAPDDGVYIVFCKTSTGQDIPEETVSMSTEPTEAETAAPETTVPETTVPETTAPAMGIRKEFKEAMDSYEAFYDEYCDFMKKYQKNPTDLSLLAQYAGMLTKAQEMDKKFEAWNESDMTNEELKYYLDVTTRIQKKMIDLF